MVKNVKGNLLNSDCDYICHQVNCQGRMGSGIAKQIKNRFPNVYDVYMRTCDDGAENIIGTIDVVSVDDDRYVVNIYGQLYYGYDGSRYTSYDAFVCALEKMKKEIPHGAKIGFPKRIGCGLGGGDWDIISSMIEAVLGKDYDVYIYEFEG